METKVYCILDSRYYGAMVGGILNASTVNLNWEEQIHLISDAKDCCDEVNCNEYGLDCVIVDLETGLFMSDWFNNGTWNPLKN